MINHPHFEYVGGTATECYRSLAMGQHFILRQNGNDGVVALVSRSDGSLPEIHQDPFAWGEDEWDCLDAVHARR